MLLQKLRHCGVRLAALRCSSVSSPLAAGGGRFMKLPLGCCFSGSANSGQNGEKSSSAHRAAQTALSDDYENMLFTKFYRFPYIVHVRAVSRLKLYQTCVTVVMIPLMGVYCALGKADISSMYMAISVATFATVMLFAISAYTRRLIGILSFNEAEDIVKVSRLTFWGNRRDIYLPLQSIIPLSEMTGNSEDIYTKFCRYDSDEVLYISLRFGGIEDKDKFIKALGTVDT